MRPGCQRRLLEKLKYKLCLVQDKYGQAASIFEQVGLWTITSSYSETIMLLVGNHKANNLRGGEWTKPGFQVTEDIQFGWIRKLKDKSRSYASTRHSIRLNKEVSLQLFLSFRSGGEWRLNRLRKLNKIVYPFFTPAMFCDNFCHRLRAPEWSYIGDSLV